MTTIPVHPARPALRDRLRPVARFLSAPLMTAGIVLMWAAVASLQTSPLLPLLPWLLLGLVLFAAGMRASGQPLSTWIDLGGSR